MDSLDCNDLDSLINPGATEVLDTVDNNCDGQIDEGICIDYDENGYGVGPSCMGPDCDDGDPTVFPGASVNNGIIAENCELQCDVGWFDCNGDLSDGCETDLNTTQHCGACGQSCPEGFECVAGNCESSP